MEDECFVFEIVSEIIQAMEEDLFCFEKPIELSVDDSVLEWGDSLEKEGNLEDECLDSSRNHELLWELECLLSLFWSEFEGVRCDELCTTEPPDLEYTEDRDGDLPSELLVSIEEEYFIFISDRELSWKMEIEESLDWKLELFCLSDEEVLWSTLESIDDSVLIDESSCWE